MAAIGACALTTPVAANGDTPFVVYSAAGSIPSAIQSVVDTFRAALGPSNGNLAGQQPGGRRDITWDDVGFGPGVTLFPSPMTTFNSPPTTRGAVFTSTSGFMINGPLGNFDGEAFFRMFSAPHLFAPSPLQPAITNVHFFVAGTDTPSTVSGFGVVFSDVDLPNVTSVECFNRQDESIGFAFAPPANDGLSFVGMIFASQRVARVQIRSGNTPLGVGTFDGPRPGGGFNDLVAMDDFIYAEPSVFGPPTDNDQCKNDGWRSFDFPRAFRNQGDCIQFVNTGN